MGAAAARAAESETSRRRSRETAPPETLFERDTDRLMAWFLMGSSD